MVCKYCGGEIQRGHNYCPYCGREADPRERVVQVRNIYIRQPAQPPQPQQRFSQQELQKLITRGFIFALIAMMAVCARPVFLLLAFVFYSQANKQIRTFGLPVPGMQTATKVLLILSLVFMVIEFILVIVFSDPSVSTHRSVYG